MLRVGDPAPQDQFSEITQLGATRVNASGGFAVSFVSTISMAAVTGFWGSFSSAPGGLLLSEGPVGSNNVVSLDDSFSIGATDLTFVGTLGSGQQAVFQGTNVIALEDDPIFGTNDFYAFLREARSDDNGRPSFIAGLSSSPGGFATRRGLFVGTNPAPLFQSGDMVPNLPAALSSQAVDFGYQFSRDGSHLIMQMALSGSPSPSDNVLSLDSVGLLLGQSLVREGSSLPASIGGLTGEVWGNFNNTVVNNDGDYAFATETSGNQAAGSVIVRNGTVFHRAGDIVDGEVLTGEVRGIAMNESGLIGCIWDVETSFGSVEALFLEERLIVKEGQPVDFDGDGSIDPSTFLRGFRDDDTLSLSDSGSLYFVAETDLGTGTPRDAYFEAEGGVVGTSYCGPAVPNSTGVPGRITALGSRVVASNSATVTATNLPPNRFGIFVVSRTQGFVVGAGGTSNGDICLGGAIGRFFMANQILGTGVSGRFSLPLPLNAFPQGNGFVSVMPGDTWNFQAWHRDTVGLGSNFTDAVSVSFL